MISIIVGTALLLQAAGQVTTEPASASSVARRDPAASVHPGPVFDGRRGKLAVSTPRREAQPLVDGRLDEPEWSSAAMLTGFSQFFPADGVAAQDSTEVLVWYSSTALHIGIRAYAPGGSVRATLADRDKITQDDNVQLFLGTYDDSRQAMVFGVNPFGIQSDGVLIETGTVSSGGFSGGTAKSRENTDLAPDYVWQSKGRLTEQGYEVELAIPFKSLRYRAGDEQRWQINVIRTVQATGHEESWAPAVRASASFLAQSGRLEGLRNLRRGLTLDLIPTVTSSAVGSTSSTSSDWAYAATRPEIGASARWGITSNLTLSGTANPDFSQVEADATQFSYDPRRAVFFPERRPFFLESQEQFAAPSQLIYTRRIVQPVAAAKLTGKQKGFDIGFLSAVDSREASLTGDGNPVFNILRLQRDLGATSRIGLAYTDKVDGANSNRVLSIDGRAVRGIMSLQWQAAGSATRSESETVLAPLWSLSTLFNGRRYYARYTSTGVSPDFDAQSGFISRPGIANFGATHRATFFGRKGAGIEVFSGELFVDGTWRYDDLVTRKPAQDVKSAYRFNTRLRGGWQVGAQLLVEEFGFDPDLYSNYYLFAPSGTGVDTVPYTGTPNLFNRDYIVSMATPEFKRFSFNTFALYGQDENFPEWSSAMISSASGTINVRPTGQIRISGTYQQDNYNRKSDGTRVLTRGTRRVRMEYQATRQMFVRLIGEYSRAAQDSLHDDTRTNLPVYLANGDGTYRRAAAVETERVRLDFLLSYLPTPGTVFYVGYGDALQSNQPAGPERITRTRDQFFVKFSYLFRMQ